MDRRVRNYREPRSIFEKKIKILCNDCLNKSETIYHHVGHKCINCGSYNTVKIADLQSRINLSNF